jgi:chemotaxis protein histidine kinase CheA
VAHIQAVNQPASVAQLDAPRGQLSDGDIPVEFREVFIEESEEIVDELIRLQKNWSIDPELNETLREMRRHFHTFKGNGRAVGANILGELGWAAQDLLDCMLDGALDPADQVQILIQDVVNSLPLLVASYKKAGGLDAGRAHELTARCFQMAKSGVGDLADGLQQVDGNGSATPDFESYNAPEMPSY